MNIIIHTDGACRCRLSAIILVQYLVQQQIIQLSVLKLTEIFNMQKWETSSKIYIDGKKTMTPEYRQWASMMTRCKVGGQKQRESNAYVGVTCSDEFANFDIWLAWANDQVGFNNVDQYGKRWNLDKDYLGHKHYSADTCVFIPMALNNFLIKSTQGSSNLPTGVTHDTSNGRDRYLAQCNIGGKQTRIGQSKTADGAHFLYRMAKEAEAKRLAAVYERSCRSKSSREVNQLCGFLREVQ